MECFLFLCSANSQNGKPEAVIPQLFDKKLKNIVIFTGNLHCWVLFLMNLQALYLKLY